MAAGNPQGKLMEERVWDCGKSECRVVMARIRIQDLSQLEKGADFRMVQQSSND
jgi:hypothetical protein